MVADLFISAHRRNTLGELYVRRDGRFTPKFLLNLTITPLGVVNCYFYFVGACTCTKSAIIYGSGFFISAHRHDMLGKLYIRRDGRFTPNFLLNLTTTPLGVVGRYFYFVGACTCTKSAIIYGSGFFISTHRRNMLGELYVRRGGHLNLTLCKAFY